MSATVVTFNPLYRRATIPEYFLAEADRAIATVSKFYPELTREGFAPDADRDEFSRRCVATGLAYLKYGPCKIIKTPTTSSYRLKHCAERWGRELGFEPYIANGDLMLAAIALNIRMGRPDGRNALLGVRVIRDVPT